VNFTCTSPERGVFSDQTGRSYNGKSINREQALIVDEPKNAKPPNLSGVMLAPLRRSYSSCLSNHDDNLPSQSCQAKN
jgi:hypothetical protein